MQNFKRIKRNKIILLQFFGLNSCPSVDKKFKYICVNKRFISLLSTGYIFKFYTRAVLINIIEL